MNASKNLKEAADTISNAPAALQLRCITLIIRWNKMFLIHFQISSNTEPHCSRKEFNNCVSYSYGNDSKS